MSLVKSLRRRKRPPEAELRLDGLVITGLSGRSIGGKGLGLRQLRDAGLPVPPTRVVSAESHQDFLRRYAEHGMPVQWRAALTAEARTLGSRLAVRSSGIEEDGERSFAGIHETVLDVAPEDVPDAVLMVWRSVNAAPAAAYGRVSAMAVLLQPMLDPAAAGVLFTVNPQSGSWREMVLEAVEGNGEALVSGRVAPKWAVFRRPRDQRRWRRNRIRRVSDERVEPLLPPATQLRLCRLGLRAEQAFGEPVDIEWAYANGRITLLQARPITHTGSPRVRDVLWTRRFLGERFPVPPTPMTWSLLAPLFEHFIAYPDVQERYLGGGSAIQLVGGYPYLNVTVFRHLLFKWPGAPAPEFMLELIPPDEADAWRRRFAVRADWAVYRAIFETTFDERRWERFAWNPFTNHIVWDGFEEGFRARIAALEDQEDPVQAGVELIRDYLAIHVCSLLFANLWYQLLDAALGAWMGPGRWMEKLAICPPGNRTLETNEALWQLGQLATPEDRERLQQGESSGAFAQALQAFLDAHGHRAETSWEIFSPRWRDEPARLVPLLGRGGAEPALRAAERERVFQETRALVLAAVPGWRRRVLDGLIHVTRRYLLLRENQRFVFDQLLNALQRELVLVGGEDVRWKTYAEFRAGTEVDLEARRRQHLGYRSREPAIFLRGGRPVQLSRGLTELEGLGISQGVVRGRVRIVRSIEEGAALREGEILVAPAVDPGWTPLLLRAGGLVLELGSMLSHGAVIAREYGVPGVVNVAGATTLETGTEVVVDGTRGRIWVESPKISPSPLP